MRVLITAFAALTLGALGLVSPLGAQGPTTTSPDAWPQFRGNTSLTGVSGSTLPDELTLQWTYEADEAIDSSAAIVDGTVYFGTWAGTVVALDLESGEEKWTYSTGDMGIGESSPAVADGLVFIGDLGGVFHAIDVQTGEARWTY
jgi:outer membrane protein assembly factor BamB